MGQSPLPPCPKQSNALYHKCFGSSGSHGGSEYLGEWENHRWHGRGVFTTQSGYKYDGQYQNGRQHGRGVETARDGVYAGEFKIGERDGQGVLTYLNGNKYSGGFKNGKPDGLGVFKAMDGFEYTGQIKDGKFHGEGIAITSDKQKLEGIWENDKFIRASKVDLQRLGFETPSNLRGTAPLINNSQQKSAPGAPQASERVGGQAPANREPNFGEQLLAEDDRRYESAMRSALENSQKSRADFEAMQEAQSRYTRKYCERRNFSSRKIFEHVGRLTRSNPSSIELKGLEIIENPWTGARCVARFYHQNGVCNLRVRFDSEGSFNLGQCE